MMSETGSFQTVDCEAMAELIPPFHENALTHEERAVVAEHLQHCGDCHAEYKRFRAMQRFANNAIGEPRFRGDFAAKTQQRMLVSAAPVRPEDEDYE